MTDIGTPGGARPRHPFGAIVVRTLVWGTIAGLAAGLGVVLPLASFMTDGLALMLAVAAAVGLATAFAGLLLAVAAWWLLHPFRLGAPVRSGIAATVPAVAIAVAWFWAIIPTGFGYLFAIPSVVVMVMAARLPDTMRDRFLAARREADARLPAEQP